MAMLAGASSWPGGELRDEEDELHFPVEALLSLKHGVLGEGLADLHANPGTAHPAQRTSRKRTTSPIQQTARQTCVGRDACEGCDIVHASNKRAAHSAAASPGLSVDTRASLDWNYGSCSSAVPIQFSTSGQKTDALAQQQQAMAALGAMNAAADAPGSGIHALAMAQEQWMQMLRGQQSLSPAAAPRQLPSRVQSPAVLAAHLQPSGMPASLTSMPGMTVQGAMGGSSSSDTEAMATERRERQALTHAATCTQRPSTAALQHFRAGELAKAVPALPCHSPYKACPTAQAAQAQADSTSAALGRVQGELSMLHQWCATTRNFHLQQSSALLAALDQKFKQQPDIPRHEVDAVSLAVQSALRIIKASVGVETQGAGHHA